MLATRDKEAQVILQAYVNKETMAELEARAPIHTSRSAAARVAIERYLEITARARKALAAARTFSTAEMWFMHTSYPRYGAQGNYTLLSGVRQAIEENAYSPRLAFDPEMLISKVKTLHDCQAWAIIDILDVWSSRAGSPTETELERLEANGN